MSERLVFQMAKDETWTPYGLEAIRQAHIRRRRILGALAVLGCLLIASLFIQTTTTKQTSLLANGNEVGEGVSIAEPTPSPPGKNYVTVSLEPGKVSRATAGNGAAADPVVDRTSMPNVSRATAFPWKYYALQLFPYLVAALAAYLLAKRRGKNDEINYGVYKGAMPLEMITVAGSKTVFTRKWAKSSVFGKGRRDHVPREAERSIMREDA